MRPLLIVNDVHLGVQRMAGTTPLTQIKLEEHLQTSLHSLLMAHLDKDLLVAGDLFDEFIVNNYCIMKAYSTFLEWLDKSRGQLTLVPGNHDIGKRSDRPSTFALFAMLLSTALPAQVTVVHEVLHTVCAERNIHVIPHCMNQDLFNMQLEASRTLDKGFLILHANVMSPFAEHSDHSLNVDDEMCTRLTRKHHLVFAHEHQRRVIDMGRGITVMGNQFPSSIADCLSHGEAQKNGRKFAHVIHLDGTLEPIPTWHRDGSFVQADWQQLADVTGDFIRVTGTATAAQASDVANTISKFRSKSEAFVISNAVKVEGVAGMDEITEMNLQAVKSFDVMEALLGQLTPAEAAVITQIMES